MDLLGQWKRKEDVSFRREGHKVSIDKILEVVSRELGVVCESIYRRKRGDYARPVAAKMLRRYGGLTQRETAQILKLCTGAAVSLQLKRLEELLSESRRLRK